MTDSITLPTTDVFFFVDLETSGLDFEQDRIVEIGWHFADERLNKIGPIFATAVHPVGAALQRIEANEYVFNMHKGTGLLDMLLASDGDNRLPSLSSVEDDILEMMEDIEGENPEVTFVWHPVGRSVHFDVRFIERFMPRLFQKLSHRILDISSLKLWLGAQGAQLDIIIALTDTSNAVAHRAGYDVTEDTAFLHALSEIAQFQEGVAVFGGDAMEEV